MKVRVFCLACSTSDSPPPMEDRMGDAVLSSRDLMAWTCKQGHKQRLWIQNPFYDLLFLRAIYDLADRDYRASMLNFHSAYETFISTTVGLIWKAMGVTTMPPKYVRRNQDAFNAVYAARTGMFAKQLPQFVRDTRNRVAHGEYVPARDDVIKAGESIRIFISDITAILAPLHQSNAIGPAMSARFAAARTRDSQEATAPTDSGPYRSPTSVLLGIDFVMDVGLQAEAARAAPYARVLQAPPGPGAFDSF